MKNELISIPKAILATLLYLVGIELIGSWIYIVELSEFKNYHNYYVLIQGALQLITVLIFIYFLKNRTFKHLLKKTHYRWYLLTLILGIGFVFMQTPLNWIYNLLFGTEYSIVYRFDGLSNLKNINFISIILLIPIGEELFFREYIQNNLQNKTNRFVAVLIASFLFSSIHAPYMNLLLGVSMESWHLFYLTLFGGVISGVLYFKSKSIGPSVLFHVFWNLTVTII
jgi:membrane protease YdiL (CAAX protease family)